MQKLVQIRYHQDAGTKIHNCLVEGEAGWLLVYYLNNLMFELSPELAPINTINLSSPQKFKKCLIAIIKSFWENEIWTFFSKK